VQAHPKFSSGPVVSSRSDKAHKRADIAGALAEEPDSTRRAITITRDGCGLPSEQPPLIEGLPIQVSPKGKR
jgi:hypothetical protein